MVVLVIMVFVGVMFANVAVAGIEHVKENWPQYRCTPGVIPIAGMFGHDAMQNFSDCISQMQMSSMSFLTQPFSMNMSVLTGGGVGSFQGIGGSLTGSANASRGMFSKIRGNMANITQSIFAVFLNLLIEIQRLFMNMKDLMGKIIGTIAAVIYFVRSAVTGLFALWYGPPGELIKALCFHPQTRVKLSDGTERPMCNLPPGCTLKNGAKVCAVMNISNTDDSGRPIEMMYSLPNGERGKPIIVSGSHLVYSEPDKKYLPVRELDPKATGALLESEPCTELSCLITSDHTIPIGEWIFHDWEDNVGSMSKNIG